MIDQANLEIQGINQTANENVSQSGIKSITVPLGSTKIKNKINSLCIIIRSYTFGDIKDERVMLDQNKQRIFGETKSEVPENNNLIEPTQGTSEDATPTIQLSLTAVTGFPYSSFNPRLKI